MGIIWGSYSKATKHTTQYKLQRYGKDTANDLYKPQLNSLDIKLHAKQ